MRKKLLIIKLGGSVVTYKDNRKPKARISVIRRLVSEIGQIYETGNYNIILIHGAGSFAHPLVKRFSIHKGMYNLKQKLAFSLTNKGMFYLNLLILTELISREIPAVSIPPHAFIRRSSGKGLIFSTDIIQEFLNHSIVSVLYGDMILDDTQNCSVLSGDVIVTFLANKLKAKKIIFLSDVDGIFDSDPKNNYDAKLIPKITNKNLKDVLSGIKQKNKDDVTGEMKGKILEIKKALTNIPVVITNGLKTNQLTQALNKDVGTTLVFG